MKLCLAGTSASKHYIEEIKKATYLLESFYYIQDWQLPIFKKCKMFLLDSGAFTFMNNFKGEVNWQKYIDKYADFIIKHDIQFFFELDIDVLVGYEQVKKYRKYLEKKVGKKCIPVWHKSRGLEEWIKMTKEYNYVAIGGIVTKEIKPKDYKYFIPMLKIAKDNGCKVHGLGLTGNKIFEYPFYSVDSTSWTSGGRFGQLHIFINKGIVTKKPIGKKAKNYKQIDLFNLKQWLKFQRYMEKNYEYR